MLPRAVGKKLRPNISKCWLYGCYFSANLRYMLPIHLKCLKQTKTYICAFCCHYISQCFNLIIPYICTISCQFTLPCLTPTSAPIYGICCQFISQCWNHIITYICAFCCQFISPCLNPGCIANLHNKLPIYFPILLKAKTVGQIWDKCCQFISSCLLFKLHF